MGANIAKAIIGFKIILGEVDVLVRERKLEREKKK